jgi:outer membrane protein assembly factor BamB
MKTSICFTLIMVFTVSCIKHKQDLIWPQFRGINGSGVADENSKPPLIFDNTLKWKTVLPSGASSPVIWNDKIFVTGYDDDRKELQTICVNRRNGKILWNIPITPDTIEEFHPISSPAQSSAVTDGERVIVHFGSCGLYCFTMDGILQWKYTLPRAKEPYGCATSPIIVGEKLMLSRYVEQNAFLIALDKKIGTEIWKVDINSAGYSIPCINNNTIYIFKYDGIAGYSLDDGSELWHFKFHSRGNGSPITVKNKIIVPFWTQLSEEEQIVKLPDFKVLVKSYDKNQNQKISKTELPDDGLNIFIRPDNDLKFSKGSVKVLFEVFDTNTDGEITLSEWNAGLELIKSYVKPAGLMAFNLENHGELSDTAVLWRVTKNIPEVPTPVYYNNRIFMIKDGGILTSTDPETGKIIYTKRIGIPGPCIASPIAANGFLYILGFNGKMKIVKAGDIFELAGEHDFKEKIIATPAIVENTIYIRTGKELLAYSK